MDIVVNVLLPFTFVQKKVIGMHVKHDNINRETFMKYLIQLTKQVEMKVSNLLPEKFTLLFYGWTTA